MRQVVVALVLVFGTVARAEDNPVSTPISAPNPTPDPTIDQLRAQMAAFKEQLAQMRAQLGNVQNVQSASLPEPSSPGDPFAWGDFTWMNGTSRQASRLLDTKYFTPQLDVDVNYTYSFNRPIDHTVVGSTALARDNELELSFLGLGGDLHVNHVRARLMLQYGTRTTVVPRNDGSTLRGQFDLQTVYRYISEAYVGYHIDKLHGINVDAGIFMSYVGLFSYDNFENWAYQPSYTSDNTPWFFNGVRIQLFPTDRLKVELWVINGWQSYGEFNETPGVGYQIRYAPREWVSTVFNGYVGTDTQDHPGRVRFHSDNSILFRYYNHPWSRGLSRAALSFTFDFGGEQGDVVGMFHGNGKEGSCSRANPCEQDFVSGMVYNRLWFWRNHLGWTVGGGAMRNPGRYLVLVPTGVAGELFDTSPGTRFNAWDVSTTADYMPSDYITFRLELVHREASVPYFAGRGGVTGPDGYKSGNLASPDGNIVTSAPPGWTPDLAHSETRIIGAIIFRI